MLCEPSLILSVVALFLMLVGWLANWAIRPPAIEGPQCNSYQCRSYSCGAERGNRGVFANPLNVDLASRERLSRTILGLSRTPTIWIPVTEAAFTFADSWGFNGYRSRLRIGLNLRCRPWTWPRCTSLGMRIFFDEPGRDLELLAWIPMGRVWVWPWRAFRIEPGAVYWDIDPSLPQQPIKAHVDSEGRITIPAGAIRIGSGNRGVIAERTAHVGISEEVERRFRVKRHREPARARPSVPWSTLTPVGYSPASSSARTWKPGCCPDVPDAVDPWVRWVPTRACSAAGSRLAAWAGLCPGNNESAGKRRTGRSRRGCCTLRAVLVECAHAAARTKNRQFQAYQKALTVRRGYKRAVVATAYKLAW